MSALRDRVPTRILVGFDGSDRSEDALALGRLLSAVLSASLVVGTVFDHPTVGGDEDPLAAGERAHAERTAADAAGRSEPTADHRVCRDDSPAHGLERIAATTGADLIVVGSSHRGPLGRVFAGSIPEQLVHGARCAVAVAPAGYAAQRRGLRNLGAAFDGSAEGREALALALRLGRQTQGNLRVLRLAGAHAAALVANPFTAAQSQRYVEEVRAREERAVRDAVDALGGASASIEIRIGEAVSGLSDSAGEFDLLLLGSRAYGTIRRVLSRSVSTHLLRDVPCPLLILPRRGDRVPDPEPAA